MSDHKSDSTPTPKDTAVKGDRIAKVMARAGLCSRRDAERWVAAGRVEVNGARISSPALNITDADIVEVDGKPLPDREASKLWRYHKPIGLVVSHRDEKFRTSVFEKLPEDLPRVVSVGRLDINTEGLLLLTNDGSLARKLELPATGWLRRYRVRVFGSVNEEALAKLVDGITIDGIHYGSIEASLDRKQGRNAWLTFALREGKNREIKVICEHLNLQVNRLIRLSYGPFQLGDLREGEVEEINPRILAQQLGEDEPVTDKSGYAQKRERTARPASRRKEPRKKNQDNRHDAKPKKYYPDQSDGGSKDAERSGKTSNNYSQGNSKNNAGTHKNTGANKKGPNRAHRRRDT